MRILFYTPQIHVQEAWLTELQQALPEATFHLWHEDATQENALPANYALLWQPPAAMLAGRSDLKAIFHLGAGVDALFKLGDVLPPNVPIFRLEDAGMAVQMAEYVSHAVLRYFRRFDEFDAQARDGVWQFLSPRKKENFSVGIMGLGVLGCRIAQSLQEYGFPLRGWSRSMKNIPGIQCFAGDANLEEFLSGTQVLVCALPLTDQTRDLLNHTNLAKLPQGSYLINVARGAHVVEPDLLALVQNGHIAGATLDVFRQEPLPPEHPFWQEKRITITPHIAALTQRQESILQIAAKIRALENGAPMSSITGRVHAGTGY